MSARVPADPSQRAEAPQPPAPDGARPARRRTNGSADPERLDPLDRAIVGLLCEAGALSPETVAARLDLSRAATSIRLRALAARGFVRRDAVRHGIGRPRHVYDVTPAGHAGLPSSYDRLASSLLESIGSVGGDELVRAVLAARRRILAERLRARLAERLGPGAPLEARVHALAAIQDDAGYLCRAGPATDGGLELREHNCAILGVIDGSDAVCLAEAELFGEVLDARVTRTGHIPGGDRACTFRVEPREQPPSPAAGEPGA